MPSVSKKQHNLMALVANDPKAAKRLGIPQSVGRDFMKADKGRKFNFGGSTMPGFKMDRMRPMARDEMEEMPMRRRGRAPMIMRKGGKAESKEMVKKELAFMKKKGAPKSMIRHEEEEMRNGRSKKFSKGSKGPVRGRGAAPAPGSLASLARHPNQNIAINAWAKGQKTMFPIYQRTGFPSGRSGTESNYQYDPAYDPAFEQGYREFEQSERGLAKGGKAHSRMKAHKAPKQNRYASGGSVHGSFRRQADGIASKGKTRGKMVKMTYGGKC